MRQEEQCVRVRGSNTSRRQVETQKALPLSMSLALKVQIRVLSLEVRRCHVSQIQ